MQLTAEARGGLSAWTPGQDRLPQALAVALAQTGTIRRCAAGSLIYQRGDPANCVSVVRSGRISMVRNSADGGSSAAAILTEGDTFGVYPLLMKRPRSHDCVALEDSALAQISETQLWALIDTSAQARRDVIGFLSDRLSRVFDAMEDERRLPLSKRLGKRLLEFADSEGHVSLSQSLLAEQLGVSRNSIGTALKTIESLGVLRVGYGRTVISDRSTLERWTQN